MQGTYKQLVQMMKEVEFGKNSLMYMLHKKDIDTFVERNMMQYDRVKTRMEELSAQFMKTDPKTGSIITEGVGQNAKPVFNEGFTLEMYSEEFNKLMSVPCKINL